MDLHGRSAMQKQREREREQEQEQRQEDIAIVQLRTWNDAQAEAVASSMEASDIKHVSVSPCWDLLSLMFNPAPDQTQVLLLPLSSSSSSSLSAAAVIADVSSCVWACLPDAETPAQQVAGFKQFLFACSERGSRILVHVFCSGRPDHAGPQCQGRFVNWAPEASALRSFLADTDLIVASPPDSHGLINLSLRFPPIPSSAEVVSFSIDCNSPSFVSFVDRPITDISCSYACSLLFCNPCGASVGMVIKGNDVVRFVTVANLHQSGISWICSIDLCNDALQVDAGDSWSDFKLSDHLLFGLTEFGRIFTWHAVNGKLVAAMDVLNYSYLRPVGEHKIQFRELTVTANSLLIAATDRNGCVHVISTDEYFCSSNRDEQELQHDLACSDLNVLSVWQVAGSSIGGQKPFSNIPNRLWLKGSVQSEPPGRHRCTKHVRRVFFPSERIFGSLVISMSSYGIIKFFRTYSSQSGLKEFKVEETPLRLPDSIIKNDDFYNYWSTRTVIQDVVGFSHQGCLYILSKSALHVVLPPLSLSSNLAAHKSQQHLQVGVDRMEAQFLKQWHVEVLNRTLVYDGCKIADDLSAENGWSLKQTKLQCLQLALNYLCFEDVEWALDSLVPMNASGDGVLKVIFSAVDLIFSKAGSDNELAQASKLVALVARFATKMVHCYGKLDWTRRTTSMDTQNSNSERHINQLASSELQNNDIGNFEKLREMASFLEVARHLQGYIKRKLTPNQGMRDTADGLPSMVGDDVSAGLLQPDLEEDRGQISEELRPILDENLGTVHAEHIISTSNESEQLALLPSDSVASSSGYMESGIFKELAISRISDQGMGRRVLPLENPEDMVKRWEVEQLDITSIVKDALRSGRLPLAVVQAHRLHSQGSTKQNEPHDAFKEVQEVGKAIVYELFCKGKAALAVAALQRLGEDIETSLRELAFGTVSRYIRAESTQELKRFGYLNPPDMNILERVSLLERLYPSSCFWRTHATRKLPLPESDNKHMEEEYKLQLLISSGQYRDIPVECGEIEGAVVGSWSAITGKDSFLTADAENNPSAGYWVGAACWLEAFEQRTMDYMILDQPLFMGVHISWESQFLYYIAHNDWEELSKLLDTIPSSVLQEDVLHVQLYCDENNANKEFSESHSDQVIDSVEVIIPKIKVLKISTEKFCAVSLRKLIETKLVKNFIFLKSFWSSTSEIMSPLAEACLFSKHEENSFVSKVSTELSDIEIFDHEQVHSETIQAIHLLLLRYCIQYELPNLLDNYIDHYDLSSDHSFISSMRAIVGRDQWAQFLLLSVIKGYEYDASFCNANLNHSRNLNTGMNYDIPEFKVQIPTIDDMAEGVGKMAALATLMYAPVPLQKCLYIGSVNRSQKASFHCAIENLRSTLQTFPTIWLSLLAVCFGQDPCSIPSCRIWKSSNGTVYKYDLMQYLKAREGIFTSAGGDTSLVQMMPPWFPKSVRQLLQLYVQGPDASYIIGGNAFVEESAGGRTSFAYGQAGSDDIDALSWEVALQKNIEQQLYTSSFEEGEFGVEHHLHRGRPIAAFNSLLANRAERIISLERDREEQIHKSLRDKFHMFLAAISPEEEKLLVSVMLLAITHFENNVLVASCVSLLQLCGISASLLLVDITALRRICLHYSNKSSNELSGSSEINVATSLAQTLASEYANSSPSFLIDRTSNSFHKGAATMRPSKAVMALLHHLEIASLPEVVSSQSSGSWLHNGRGNRSKLRSKQQAASERWCFVTTFCQVHQLPISNKYLAFLARDNDWVGFLSEAQFEGFSIDSVISVASKEFNDVRLQSHILTVLKSMQSSNQKIHSSVAPTQSIADNPVDISLSLMGMPEELFSLLAECEKQKKPGRQLLVKARDLQWPLLAVIASCFQDVSSFSCLTVWLEITAARETSTIKIDNVATRIAAKVGAAVEATNSLPRKYQPFKYNRKNPKRRRVVECSSAINGPDSEMPVSENSGHSDILTSFSSLNVDDSEMETKKSSESTLLEGGLNEEQALVCRMVGVLCEQLLFLPLLKAFDLFLPTCSLLPFIRFLQAFSQMRLSEASAHIASFSSSLKDETHHGHTSSVKGLKTGTWVTFAALKGADAVLSTCPSPYERQYLLKLLSSADFGDGGGGAARYRRLFWKVQLAEPALRQGADLILESADLDDAALLTELVKKGYWDEARSWAKQLESSSSEWKDAVHHVTERQAEAMVLEWKQFLWDVPEEQAALWGHCQDLFVKYAFPPLQAGMFFLRHAEAIEMDVPVSELHKILLLALQWLSGLMTESQPVYPLHLLREIETRVWLLAVESEAEEKDLKGTHQVPMVSRTTSIRESNMGKHASVIDRSASIIAKMDAHLSRIGARSFDQIEKRETGKAERIYTQTLDTAAPSSPANYGKQKRRNRILALHKRFTADNAEEGYSASSVFSNGNEHRGNGNELFENDLKMEASLSGWEERVGSAEVETAILALLEVGQIAAAKQLQQKLSPTNAPPELLLIDEALSIADSSTTFMRADMTPTSSESSENALLLKSASTEESNNTTSFEALQDISNKCREGCGRGLCKRIMAVLKIANFLGLSFSEAFQKQPIELLQLLSLNAQDSFEKAKSLVETHLMPPASIAKILAESFLKGLLAAHRGGYLGSSQKEEGPAPLLWRPSDFLKWSELCASQPELGHALMRIVITGQDIPHACEVELLILAHQFYKTSACLDGVDVLVALAATRAESYVSDRDFGCLARLVVGINNLHALHFILDMLIENGQLQLLLRAYSDTGADGDCLRAFRISVLAALERFNAHDTEAFMAVYEHFGMKHEKAALLERRAAAAAAAAAAEEEEALEMMRLYVDAAEARAGIDAGGRARWAAAQAQLAALQVRMPELQWLGLSETQARRLLVAQPRFHEALTVAEAYSLNAPAEWALALWNHMPTPDVLSAFLADLVCALPLPPSLLLELARFYRVEIAARGGGASDGDAGVHGHGHGHGHMPFTRWLASASASAAAAAGGGGEGGAAARSLGKSFRMVVRRTRDMRLRVQLATIATGFPDVVDAAQVVLDKLPESAGPLILRKGHGGAYLPLM